MNPKNRSTYVVNFLQWSDVIRIEVSRQLCKVIRYSFFSIIVVTRVVSIHNWTGSQMSSFITKRFRRQKWPFESKTVTIIYDSQQNEFHCPSEISKNSFTLGLWVQTHSDQVTTLNKVHCYYKYLFRRSTGVLHSLPGSTKRNSSGNMKSHGVLTKVLVKRAVVCLQFSQKLSTLNYFNHLQMK